MLCYVPRDCMDYLGWGAQGSHLDCHTAPELWGQDKITFQKTKQKWSPKTEKTGPSDFALITI